jgi:hypothetical protein
VLLVCSLTCGVGSTHPRRNLLARSPCVVGCHDPFRNGNRLCRQLAQESHPSLRYHWAAIPDRRSGIPVNGPEGDSPQQPLGLAIRCHRGRHRVSTGMAVYAAFSVIALGDAIARSGRLARHYFGKGFDEQKDCRL